MPREPDVSELLKEKFAAGMSAEAFEATLGEHAEMFRHYYAKAAVEAFAERAAGVPELRIIVISEPWCLDTFAVVPPILKLLGDNSRVQIRFVARDQNPDLMDQYLTRGGRAIPKLVVMDADFNEYFNLGPRPQAAQQIYEDHRQMIAEGKIEKSEVTKKIRAFFARDRGVAVLTEFFDLLDNHL